MPHFSESVHIAIAADDRYVPHAAAMLHSLRWNNRMANILIHFLHGPELSKRKRRMFEAMANRLNFRIQWLEIAEERIRGLPRNVEHISKVVWYRLFMPELLPNLNRILYLDCDVVVTDSIAPLWRIPLEDHYFAAVTNAVPDYHSHRAEELGLPGPQHCFNLGVALWNLDIMRREGFTEQVLAYSRENGPRLLWMEQDAINALYWNKRLHVPPRWNCQNGIFFSTWGLSLFSEQERREAVERPALVHFEGGSFGKPWHFLSTHPLRSRYFFHRRRTPWPLLLPEGVTLKNILKKYLPHAALDFLLRARGFSSKIVAFVRTG